MMQLCGCLRRCAWLRPGGARRASKPGTGGRHECHPADDRGLPGPETKHDCEIASLEISRARAFV